MGILIGDGKLNYRPEMVLETYYAFSPVKWVVLSLDYQFIADPGYNADRGPVSIFFRSPARNVLTRAICQARLLGTSDESQPLPFLSGSAASALFV